MIKELSRTRLLWDSLILALILVSCVMVPYQFAFNQGSALSGFQVIYLIDLFFIIDIFLNCCTTFRRHGIEISDRPSCTKHYARRLMAVDILGSLPLDLVAWALIGNGQFLGGSLVLALLLPAGFASGQELLVEYSGELIDEDARPLCGVFELGF